MHVTSTSNMVAYWGYQIKGLVRTVSVSEPVQSDFADDAGQRPSSRRPPLLWVLIVLLTAEFALMAVVSIVLVVELFVGSSYSIAAGIAVLVLSLTATVWLGFIAVAAIRSRAWMRGASIVWQVLMFAIGIGCFQGLTATPTVGWALVIPAVVVVALLVSKPVVRATANRD
ncbi:MAG: hypothetical protein JWP75_702 [Frondihabitans sp.]|nr:hypothetical protein [Frondihabitans sp.]